MGKKAPKTRHPETAVLVVSDVHFGKRTPSFNPDICAARLVALRRKVTQIAAARRAAGASLQGLVVALIGDVNDGTDIFPTQPHHQDISNVEQQARQIAGILYDFGKWAALAFGSVRFECVAGNHGRSGRAAHEAASWDIVAYRYLKLLADGGKAKVYVVIDDENPFLRVIDVRGHGILLYHGHDILSYAGIPWYGIMQRILRWRSTRAMKPFRVAIMGHFHTLGHWAINAVDVFTSGTFISGDEWALQTFGWESATRTWMFGVDDNAIPTWQYAIDLTDGVNVAA